MMTEPKKARWRGWLGNIALLLGSLLVTLLLGEGLLRLTMGDHVVMFPRFHDRADYGTFVLRRMTPNTHFTHSSVDGSWTFTINAEGFRDTEDYTKDKPPGVFRVLVLGDSHTQGYEVDQEQTFAEVLERRLIRAGLDAQAMNTGVSGFSTAEELAFLEDEGVEYAPDAIVLGFFANDFDDNIKADLFHLQDGVLETVKTEHVPGVRALALVDSIPGTRWLSQHSYLYSLALNTAWEMGKQALLDSREAEFRTEYAVRSEAEVAQEKADLALALLARMHQVAQARDIPFIVVDIPQVGEGDDMRSSIPVESLAAFRANADAVITAESVLGDYRGLTEFHVPHGHRHINAVTHLLLGKAIGEEILTLRDRQSAAE